MHRNVVLLVFVSILLVSAVAGAGVVKRGVDVAGSGASGQGAFSASEQSGSIDWWPMFHHDLNHTGYSTSKAPNNNHTLWIYPTNSQFSFAAIVDGVCYVVGTYPAYTVYALNETTGALVWSHQIDGILDPPAVVDGIVFVPSFYEYKVYALNASTGGHIWNYTTGSYVASSPAVVNGVVYFGSVDNRVYALNATTGVHIWNYTTGGSVYSSPAVAEGKVYVGSYDQNVYCLNASTGDYIWSRGTGNYVGSSPAVADGKVFVGTSDSGIPSDTKICCLNATNGDNIWKASTGSGNPGYRTSPAVAYNMVFTGGQDGKTYAFNASDGALKWSYTTGAIQGASPAVADGKLYIGSANSKVYALNATTGVHIWNYTTGGSVYSAPSVADGMLFIGSYDRHLYCFGSHDVAITNVMPSATEAYAGQTVNITVVAKNDGTFNETFSVRAYCDSTLIGTQTVTDLPQDEERTLTFTWNTMGVLGGYYTVSANATIVPGEADLADNNFIDGTMKVTSPVRITEVIPCNQTGYPKDVFELGTLAFFKVTINSTATILQNTLITINLYDNSNITIDVVSFQTQITPGISTIIFGLPIPATATTGIATVYANCYTDWPSLGGFPHCPEMSATLEITGP